MTNDVNDTNTLFRITLLVAILIFMYEIVLLRVNKNIELPLNN